MLFLAVIILLTSLAIAGVAAYFSVIGLSLLFVGSGVSIIIMGSILEVGKLITVSVLHQLWDKLGKLLKMYLLLASFVLMLITSIGIYGYLSNGYNATNVKVKSYENQKNLLIEKSNKLKLDNTSLSTIVNKEVTAKPDNINEFTQQQSQLILSKQVSIKEIRDGILSFKQKASDDINAAKNLLESEVNKELSQISLINNRLQILDREVDTWLNQGTGGLFKQNGLDKARIVKDQQKPERDSIDQQIKALNTNIERLRLEYKAFVESTNVTLDERIKTSEANIQKLEQEIVFDKQLIVDAQNKQKQANDLALVNEEQDKKRKLENIQSNEQEIASIEKQIAVIETNIINTDVGTFKFVAKSLNLDLDKTVNIFILLIIFAFDPLAVALLLCFNYLVKQTPKKEIVKKEPIQSYIPPVPEPTNQETDTSKSKKEFPYTEIENNKIAYRAYPVNQ
jgi:hypothetical protein